MISTLLANWKLWLGLTLMQLSFGSFYNFFTIYLWSFGVLAEMIMLFYQARFSRKNLLLIPKITTNS